MEQVQQYIRDHCEVYSIVQIRNFKSVCKQSYQYFSEESFCNDYCKKQGWHGRPQHYDFKSCQEVVKFMNRFYTLVDCVILQRLDYCYPGLSVKSIQKLEKDLWVEFPLTMAGYLGWIGGGHKGDLPGYEYDWETVILYRPYDIKNEMQMDHEGDQPYYLRRIPIGFSGEYSEFRVNCRKASANYGKCFSFVRPSISYKYLGNFADLVKYIGKKLKQLDKKQGKAENDEESHSAKKRKISTAKERDDEDEDDDEEDEEEQQMYYSDSGNEPDEDIGNLDYNFSCRKPKPFLDYS